MSKRPKANRSRDAMLNHEMSFYISNYRASLRCTTRSVKKERITICLAVGLALLILMLRLTIRKPCERAGVDQDSES